MQKKADGQNYAPKGKAKAVCKPGDFKVGVIGLDHGHIYGMCNGLVESGAEIELVWDSDPAKIKKFLDSYPNVKIAKDDSEIYTHPELKMIATASIPNKRADIGILSMKNGKDFFCDKPACTTLDQLEKVKQTVKETNKKFMIYFSERLHVEASVYTQQLIDEGKIGDIVQIMTLAPHRIDKENRPSWFFEKEEYGGIITDIGSHQIEQILHYAKAKDAEIVSSRVANYNNKEYPNFEDFGEVVLECDNGISGYFRVDWFTPKGLGAWGDGRTFIIGTKGYIEIRKYINVATDKEGDHVFVVTDESEEKYNASGKCGFPYFANLILDCINRSENAMTQEAAFKAMEVTLKAQKCALNIENAGGAQ